MASKAAAECAVIGCSGVHHAKGLCHRCYKKQWRAKKGPCMAPLCKNIAERRDLCRKHKDYSSDE
jgi:hypothetical protein